MRRSKAEIYLHLVWATKSRQLLLTPDIERRVYRCIESQARAQRCDVLAIGGTDDHVHVVLKTPTGVAPSVLAKQIKGVSSRFIGERLQGHEGFGWQEGYGVFSLSRPDVKRVILYVERQKEHHAAGNLWPQWEETDEITPERRPQPRAESPGGRPAEGPPDGYFNARSDGRGTLYSLLGDLPPRDRPVSAETVRVEEREAYTLEVLRLDLNGEEPVPAYFIRPKTSGPWPAVVYNHSHGGNYALGKDEFLQGREYIVSPWADELALRGLCGLCIDHRCFGERRNMAESEAFKLALWRGQVLWGLMVYDTLKAADYLVSRPDVVPSRVVTLGMSMGSVMAQWHAALDERVAACVDICCLTDYQSLIACCRLDAHGLYYYVPGLLKHFTAAEVNALICPRPHLALAGDLDMLTPPEGLERIDAHLQRVYAVAGVPERWELARYQCGHVELPEMREQAIAFLMWQIGKSPSYPIS